MKKIFLTVALMGALIACKKGNEATPITPPTTSTPTPLSIVDTILLKNNSFSSISTYSNGVVYNINYLTLEVTKFYGNGVTDPNRYSRDTVTITNVASDFYPVRSLSTAQVHVMLSVFPWPGCSDTLKYHRDTKVLEVITVDPVTNAPKITTQIYKTL